MRTITETNKDCAFPTPEEDAAAIEKLTNIFSNLSPKDMAEVIKTVEAMAKADEGE